MFSADVCLWMLSTGMILSLAVRALELWQTLLKRCIRRTIVDNLSKCVSKQSRCIRRDLKRVINDSRHFTERVGK